MDAEAQLEYLLELAETLGVCVRRVAGRDAPSTAGADMVRLRDKELLFVDTAAPVADQAAAVARALCGRKELQEMFLPPDIRSLIGGGSDGF